MNSELAFCGVDRFCGVWRRVSPWLLCVSVSELHGGIWPEALHQVGLIRLGGYQR